MLNYRRLREIEDHQGPPWTREATIPRKAGSVAPPAVMWKIDPEGRIMWLGWSRRNYP